MLYTISPDYPFLDSLARGLLEKYGDNPLEFSNITLLLPNRRACRAMGEAFLRNSGGKPMLLPAILPLGDMDEDNIMFNMGEDLPKIISPSHQRIILAQLIEKWQNTLHSSEKITTPQAAKLAISLASFLAEVEKEQLNFKDIEKIVPDDLSNHWQITLQFLSILINYWPEELKNLNATDIHSHRNKILHMQAENWMKNPPAYPIIAAGSTGSIPATANLLKVIESLPNGIVILPGLDLIMDEKSWDNITESHPQYGLKSLMGNMKKQRGDVALWPYCKTDENYKGRSHLISEIMRPSATTKQWQNIDNKIQKQIDGISIINAANLHEEATAIALIMKKALHNEGKTAALVTNLRPLAKRVAAILHKWNITVDDSAGNNLSETSNAVYLRLLAKFAEDGGKNPVSFLSLLKHPFAAGGGSTVNFRNNVRIVEIAALRGIRPLDGISSIYAKINDKELFLWLKNIEEILKPLTQIMKKSKAPLVEIIKTHLQVAESLAATDIVSGAESLWSTAAGEQLKDFFDELFSACRNFKEIDPTEYASLLDTMLEGQTYRPQYGTHPRLFILSPIEARMLHFDLVIMGGLNEGSWPAAGQADPWMSRPMRASFGLPLPEKRIGQSAHDFCQLFCLPEIILSRAEKTDGTQTIASRWLLRLQAVLKILQQENSVQPAHPWLLWADALNRPEEVISIEPPAPKPPLDIRPIKLPVTSIEKLMRDPYSVYAAKILGLKKLDKIDKDPDASEFGTFIHKALEVFTQAYETIYEGDHLNFLLQSGRIELHKLEVSQTVEAFWWPRFERIAKWFVEHEIKRRINPIKVICEQKGAYQFKAGRDFTLEARADRIETDKAGNINIIDYKTGYVPSHKDIKNGLSPQMVLEGLIANKGGFGIEGTIAALEHWKLSGGNDVADIKPLKAKELEDMINDSEAGLYRLIAEFYKEDTAYLSCPAPEDAPKYNDYEHLARRKEWE